MPDYEVIDTPWVRCPECGKIFKGEVRVWKYLTVFTSYSNECPHCGYMITESDFEEVKYECMTREEQIQRKLLQREQQLKRELQIQEAAFNCGYVTGYSTFAAYMKGAKWADSSPNWHKFSDEKPPLEQRILVYTTKGRIAETVWRQPMLVSGEPHGEPTFEDNRYNKHNVIAWMEKPEPPKFD